MSRLGSTPLRDRWSDSDIATLRQLVRLELPMRFIARKLDRPERLVRQRAHRMVMAEMTAVPRRSG